MEEAATIGTAPTGMPAGDVGVRLDGVSEHFGAFVAEGRSVADEPSALAAAAGSQSV